MKKFLIGCLVIMTLGFTACGNKVDKGSLEENRIIVDGVPFSFGVDTKNDVAEKNTDKHKYISNPEDGSTYFFTDSFEDGSSSLFADFDENQILYSMYLEVSVTNEEDRINFSLGDINENSSFLDVLTALGLTKNGEYPPYEEQMANWGNVYQDHTIENGSISVRWDTSSGFIEMNTDNYNRRYQFSFLSEEGSITDNNSLAAVSITVQ